MQTVSFRQMQEGTKEDYDFLGRLEQAYIDQLPERIMGALRALDATLSGYKVTRLEHSLQTAARAEADGADDEMIVGALIHDLGDDLAPENHSRYAATIIQPYVRDEVTWVVRHHGLFQTYFYAHHYGEDPNARDIYRDHPFYDACVRFCRLGSDILRPRLSDAVAGTLRGSNPCHLFAPSLGCRGRSCVIMSRHVV